MCKKCHTKDASRRKNPKGSSFNYIEQLGTGAENSALNLGEIESEFSDERDNISSSKKTVLQKRAHRKTENQFILKKLIEAAEKNEDSLMAYQYVRALDCGKEIEVKAVTEGGETFTKTVSSYCGARFCKICAAIRMGVLFRQYSPVLNTWIKDSEGAYMVTLTVRNVTKKGLYHKIKEMRAVLTRIKNKWRQRQKRGTELESLEGILKVECTYNERTNTFHPHFHLVISGERQAAYVLSEWLSRFPKNTSHKGQDLQKITDGSSLEMFKYFTKFAGTTSKKMENGKWVKEKAIFASALDVMFNAFRGLRVFQNFGFKISDYSNKTIQRESQNSPDEIGQTKMNLPFGEKVVKETIGPSPMQRYRGAVSVPMGAPKNKISDGKVTDALPFYLKKYFFELQNPSLANAIIIRAAISNDGSCRHFSKLKDQLENVISISIDKSSKRPPLFNSFSDKYSGAWHIKKMPYGPSKNPILSQTDSIKYKAFIESKQSDLSIEFENIPPTLGVYIWEPDCYDWVLADSEFLGEAIERDDVDYFLSGYEVTDETLEFLKNKIYLQPALFKSYYINFSVRFETTGKEIYNKKIGDGDSPMYLPYFWNSDEVDSWDESVNEKVEVPQEQYLQSKFEFYGNINE